MEKPIRISVEEARKEITEQSGLLVCSYDSDRKFRKVQLEGAIPFSEFEKRLPSLSNEQKIIFYCA